MTEPMNTLFPLVIFWLNIINDERPRGRGGGAGGEPSLCNYPYLCPGEGLTPT